MPGFTLGEGFAHTDNGRDARRQRSFGLVCHQHIGLAVVLTTLRMANDGITATKVVQHGGAHFARVRAGNLRRNILRAEFNRRALASARVGRSIRGSCSRSVRM